jgi:hypothetical protein
MRQTRKVMRLRGTKRSRGTKRLRGTTRSRDTKRSRGTKRTRGTKRLRGTKRTRGTKRRQSKIGGFSPIRQWFRSREIRKNDKNIEIKNKEFIESRKQILIHAYLRIPPSLTKVKGFILLFIFVSALHDYINTPGQEYRAFNGSAMDDLFEYLKTEICKDCVFNFDFSIIYKEEVKKVEKNIIPNILPIIHILPVFYFELIRLLHMQIKDNFVLMTEIFIFLSNDDGISRYFETMRNFLLHYFNMVLLPDTNDKEDLKCKFINEIKQKPIYKKYEIDEELFETYYGKSNGYIRNQCRPVSGIFGFKNSPPISLSNKSLSNENLSNKKNDNEFGFPPSIPSNKGYIKISAPVSNE